MRRGRKRSSSDTSTQPFIATFPPRASMPTAILPPYFSARATAKSGFVHALVPIIARPAPASNARLTEASSRRPPAELDKHAQRRYPRYRRKVGGFPRERPVEIHDMDCVAPASANDLAASSGFSKYTVLSAALPILRRTHFPSFMSTAGYIFIRLFGNRYSETGHAVALVGVRHGARQNGNRVGGSLRAAPEHPRAALLHAENELPDIAEQVEKSLGRLPSSPRRGVWSPRCWSRSTISRLCPHSANCRRHRQIPPPSAATLSFRESSRRRWQNVIASW